MSKGSITSIYPKILPFFKMVAIYFIVSFNLEDNKIFYCCAKISPIIVLAVILQFQQGIKTKYINLISLGLLFSAVGDIFMVFRTKGYLGHGTLFFTIAHFFYITAFGFSPLKFQLAIPFLIVALISFGVICIVFSGITCVLLLIYAIVVCSMGWRAVSQVYSSATHYVYKHMKFGAAIGGAFFIISDMMLCLEILEIVTVPHFGIPIMLTYYVAQLGLAISALKAL